MRRNKTWEIAPCSRNFLDNFIVSHLVKKFSSIHVTRRFITAFTLVSILSYMSPVCPSYAISLLWSILISSFHPGLGLHKCLFPLGVSYVFHACHSARPCCPNWVYQLNNAWWNIQIIKTFDVHIIFSSLLRFLGLNLLLTTPFTNTLHLRLSLNMRCYVSHSFKQVKLLRWHPSECSAVSPGWNRPKFRRWVLPHWPDDWSSTYL
jgi:hypothetical protein